MASISQIFIDQILDYFLLIAAYRLLANVAKPSINFQTRPKAHTHINAHRKTPPTRWAWTVPVQTNQSINQSHRQLQTQDKQAHKEMMKLLGNQE